MFDRMIAQISASIAPFLNSFTGGNRSPSCSALIAEAENPPGTIPPVSGQCPVFDSQHQSRPCRQNGITKRTSIRWVPPR